MIKPKTRKEKILSAIANDTEVPIQPKNREELFLAQIAEKTSNVPKPLTYDYMPEGYPYIDPVGGRMLIWSDSCTGEKTNGLSGTITVNNMPENLIVGEAYVVTFNGVDYECVCGTYGIKKSACIGNLYAYVGNNLVDNTGEPFFFIHETTRTINIYTLPDNTDPFTYTINKAIPAPVPMDEKFLPDSVKGGGGCVEVYASQNRLYADEDMSEEITSFEEDWLGIICSGKLVLLYDMDDDWHGFLITNVDGRTVNCGHKAFYTNGGYPE